MDSELISVVIPTYNRAQTLLRAVGSVLRQSYSNFELIIVDDGSSDNTAEVAAGIKDKRVKYVRFFENKGVSAARNAGIRESRGEYIAFLDSDDEWFFNKLKSSLKVFRQNKHLNIGLVHSNGWFIKGGQKRKFFSKPTTSGVVYGEKERKAKIFPTRAISPGPPFWLLPAKVVSEIGFFDESMSNWEDVDFFVRVANSFDIYFLNNILVNIYEREDHLGQVTVKVMKCKDYFWQKHSRQMLEDRWSVYRFIWRMGKDWFKLGDKKQARKYFFQALKSKPYKLEILAKLFMTLRSRKVKTFFISFLNINFCLKTNNAVYASFLEKYFSSLINDSKQNSNIIFIDVSWEYRHWIRRVYDTISGNYVRVGANTYAADKAAATTFKEREKIFFSWKEKGNRIFSKAIIRSRLYGRSFFAQGPKQKDYFYQLTLQAVYYPLFYYFHKKQNLLVMHASAVEYNKRGILFCGLDGVGKTNCALSIVKNRGAFLLSDNLVLVGAGKVYSCYEQIRLDKNQTYVLDKNLGVDPSSSSKGFYYFPKEKSIDKSGIDLVFFIESAFANKVIPINLSEAISRAVDLNRLSGELQRYSWFYSLYNLASGTGMLSEKEIVDSAFSGAKLFRVQLDFSLGLRHNMEFMETLVDSLS